MKTTEEIEEEINREGEEIHYCPVCRESDDIDFGYLIADEYPYRDCECKKCNATWNEYYKWCEIANLKLGE